MTSDSMHVTGDFADAVIIISVVWVWVVWVWVLWVVVWVVVGVPMFKL